MDDQMYLVRVGVLVQMALARRGAMQRPSPVQHRLQQATLRRHLTQLHPTGGLTAHRQLLGRFGAGLVRLGERLERYGQIPAGMNSRSA
jgi:hypothetical protein